MPKQRVLIVDERPVRARRLMQHLGADTRIEPLGPAGTLTDAYNLTETHQPDVICIGSEFFSQPEFLMYRALVEALGLRSVAYAMAGAESCDTGSDRRVVALPEFGVPSELIRTICEAPSTAAASIFDCRPAAQSPNPPSRCVVIGSSTGGIEALLELLSRYPEDCPPTLIVQHIRADFVAGLVQRLDRNCRSSVLAARDGAALVPGQVHVAPDDRHHLVIRPGGVPRCRLVPGEPVSGHRPSVDMLFGSAAALGDGVVGVLLTGMGRDGAEGLLEIRRNGGRTIVQDRQTSTVYGMPRAAAEIGAAMVELPLRRIGQAILHACRDTKVGAG